MKKRLLLATIAAFFTVKTSMAQTGDPAMEGSKFGLGADFAFPMGAFKDQTNYGVGASLLYQHPIAKNLNITGNVGYLELQGKKTIINLKYTEGFIPVKAGARYFLAENIYGGAELGVSISTASGNGSGTSFIYVPSAGVEFPVSDTGSVDVGIRYESWTRSSNTRSFIGIRAGYNF
ncbi:outer membrane beta-barrel protein [Pedobacter steynii]|uniref:Outer membrane protein beta-barrel domain-containing protein n=1 Tax=Pedobacter steynii TaxID=430522 RepID=A0A1D7QI06_9SPHI|nr:outer membrane beta-barrel protein [Pedobacter steynii]AOM78298.1 hypothetical protein BFS30_14630 [Pedobacter steynii]